MSEVKMWGRTIGAVSLQDNLDMKIVFRCAIRYNLHYDKTLSVKSSIGFVEFIMRLSELEKTTICQTLRAIDQNGRVYLVGSRVDDNKKGGDVDLFFEASTVLDLKTQLRLQYQLTSMLDNKVDLLVKNPDDIEQSIFTIAREGVLL